MYPVVSLLPCAGLLRGPDTFLRRTCYIICLRCFLAFVRMQEVFSSDGMIRPVRLKFFSRFFLRPNKPNPALTPSDLLNGSVCYVHILSDVADTHTEQGRRVEGRAEVVWLEEDLEKFQNIPSDSTGMRLIISSCTSNTRQKQGRHAAGWETPGVL